MQVSVTMSGDLTRKISQLVKDEPFSVRRAVSEATVFMWAKTAQSTPKWRGELRKAMSYKVSGFRGVVDNKLKYAQGIHEGTRPHWIPKRVWSDESSDFSKWAKEHGIPPFVLARSIAKKGTKPQPWFRDSAQKYEKDIWKIFKEEIDKTLKQKV